MSVKDGIGSMPYRPYVDLRGMLRPYSYTSLVWDEKQT